MALQIAQDHGAAAWWKPRAWPAARSSSRQTGGADNDVLVGSPGDDVLLGGDGDDVLLGGPGADRLDGDPGDNIVIQD
jgi:Ca2+-binding RTX toxin-like protein